MSYWLGVDTGGTFTDFVLLGEATPRIHKVLSTPAAPEEAILQGIREMGLEDRLRAGELVIVHGTTVATNAALESKGARTVLRLHPRLAPYKAAILPLVKKDGMPEVAREIAAEFFAAGINARYDEQHTIGKRYARHDEIGTPYCITVDEQTAKDRTVTIRYRDDKEQDRIELSAAVDVVMKALRSASPRVEKHG